MTTEFQTFNQANINLTERIYMRISPTLSENAVSKMLASRREEDPNFNAKQYFDLRKSSITWTHIAMCIKDNLDQSLGELALRLCLNKNIPYTAAAVMVRILDQEGLLYYFDLSYRPHKWTPGTKFFDQQQVMTYLLGEAV